jgi:predicted dehydrogenase
MPVPSGDGKLGVGVTGIGWCAAQHIAAFQKNPDVAVRWLHGRDEGRIRQILEREGLSVPDARITTRFEDLLEAQDVHIISITTPNHLHASQAVAAARAGKHIVLEKPTGLDVEELAQIRAAVREAGVRTIVSFELRYNPFLKFVRWMRESGRLGDIRFARTQYLSNVTDWYPGWDWVRTRASGRSHLLAAGCHAVDALRWCAGREVLEVSAFHTSYTAGYEWPTSIVVNAKLEGGALGHVTSSTDFMLPYTFGVELMGDRATIRQDFLQALGDTLDLDALRTENPFSDVTLAAAVDGLGRPGIRIECAMPGSADVSHHPFQAEMDELVACVRENRPTSIDVFEAERTMEVCLAADKSAELGGMPIALPLIAR